MEWGGNGEGRWGRGRGGARGQAAWSLESPESKVSTGVWKAVMYGMRLGESKEKPFLTLKI